MAAAINSLLFGIISFSYWFQLPRKWSSYQLQLTNFHDSGQLSPKIHFRQTRTTPFFRCVMWFQDSYRARRTCYMFVLVTSFSNSCDFAIQVCLASLTDMWRMGNSICKLIMLVPTLLNLLRNSWSRKEKRNLWFASRKFTESDCSHETF